MAALPSLVCVIMVAMTTLSLSLLAERSVDESPIVQGSCYCLQQIIDQIKNSVSVVFYQDGLKERLLVVEQRGVVFRYETDGFRIGPFLDIRDRVVISDDFGESRGLLSVVLDPSFDGRGNVYAYYIRKENDKDYAYVSVFNAQNGVADPKSERFLLRIYQPYVHGNGGPMLFGDDGYLYIVTGDGEEHDDTTGRAQDLNSFHGKVLRIDVKQQGFTDGESGTAMLYSVPETNPFVNRTNARSEVFASGIRNMWGCSQDSATRFAGTGRIFCAETGTNISDEINIIESGRNYGWDLVEGTKCRNASGCATIENEGRPIYEFSHTSKHALVGGYLYRGQEITEMVGAGYYIYGDILTGKTYYLDGAKPGKWDNHEWRICEPTKCPHNAKEGKLSYILAFGQDYKGELYLLMTDELVPQSDSGKVFKIVHPNSSAAGVKYIAAVLIAVAAVMSALETCFA